MNIFNKNLSNKTNLNNTKAFSLIEVSIVLIIVALVVAGIMSGKSLITNSKLIVISSDIKSLTIALQSFQDSFNMLPGDANTTIGGIIENNTRGNGDLYIGDGDPLNSESINAFVHLSKAKFVDGTFTGLNKEDKIPTNLSEIDSNIYPESKSFKNIYIYLAGTDINGDFNKGNRLLLVSSKNTNGNAFDAKLAKIYDCKFDDCNPLTGKIITNNINFNESKYNNNNTNFATVNFNLINTANASTNNNCLIIKSDGTIDYNIETKNVNCSPIYNLEDNSTFKSTTIKNEAGSIKDSNSYRKCTVPEITAYSSKGIETWLNISVGNSLSHGSELRGSCALGYTIKTFYLKCNNGSWTEFSEACEPAMCNNPTYSNATFTETSLAYNNGTISGTCTIGHEGSITATCNSSGEWAYTGSCNAKICNNPTQANATFTETSLAYNNGSITGVCINGYNGSITASCNTSGQWVYENNCNPVNCNTPAQASNGTANINWTTTNGTTYTKQAILTCATGYNSTGLAGGITTISNTCQASGSWSNDQSCKLVSCNTPAQASNGTTNINWTTTNGTTYSKQATLTCATGYNSTGLAGGATTISNTCQANGSWSNNQSCKLVSCGTPSFVANAIFTTTTTNYNGTANYSCNDNYNINDTTYTFARTCQADGTWSKAADCVLASGNFISKGTSRDPATTINMNLPVNVKNIRVAVQGGGTSTADNNNDSRGASFILNYKAKEAIKTIELKRGAGTKSGNLDFSGGASAVFANNTLVAVAGGGGGRGNGLLYGGGDAGCVTTCSDGFNKGTAGKAFGPYKGGKPGVDGAGGAGGAGDADIFNGSVGESGITIGIGAGGAGGSYSSADSAGGAGYGGGGGGGGYASAGGGGAGGGSYAISQPINFYPNKSTETFAKVCWGSDTSCN